MKQLLPLVFITFLFGCQKEELTEQPIAVEQEPVISPVPAVLSEASGMADSKVNPGHLWVHEDGENATQLFLLSHSGKLAKTIYLKGITNRDWEDIALAGNDLYLADIGDNLNRHNTYTIYKFTEPSVVTDTVTAFQSIMYKYPDGPHDAEAILVDPSSKDIYIITKRDRLAGIYKISYPYSYSAVNTAEMVGTLPYSGVVSASLSPDGKGIIVKTYASLYFYSRSGKEPISDALQKKLTTLPYKVEPQGEAVSFSLQNKGYFTLSEKAFKDEANLYLYKLKE